MDWRTLTERILSILSTLLKAPEFHGLPQLDHGDVIRRLNALLEEEEHQDTRRDYVAVPNRTGDWINAHEEELRAYRGETVALDVEAGCIVAHNADGSALMHELHDRGLVRKVTIFGVPLDPSLVPV